MTGPTERAPSSFPLAHTVAPEQDDFETIRTRLDSGAFNALRHSPYYSDSVYPRFSPSEYDRRLRLTREKMARLGLDCLIVGTAPLLQSYGGPVQWLTGHRDWHALAVYVVVPLTGEPTLIYPMGGTHIEATRRAVPAHDVRSSRQGHFMEVAAERSRDLGVAH
ncbi:MAG: hypothetical protein ACXWQ5_12885, partial [Ktedonobacterales bacterium]